MNGRDGRYDSGDMNDADWLLSQLGSGRRPDLEGRQAPQPPVAQPPQPPAEPVSPPPMERPRRRSEESLDWFSLAEPTSETDAATRELPVVGEPIQRRDEPPQPPAQPAWEQNPWEQQAPAWNQPPAWDDRRPPIPPRAPQHPGPPDRLTSVEPPVGAPVPPAFGGPQAPPPGPVTPPANFALTWGEQQPPVDTEDGLRAAFRQLSEPAGPVPPAAPTAGSQAFPPARTDFDDELWSALNEEPQAPEQAARAWDPYDDGRGYSDEQAYADSSGQDDQGYGREEHGDGQYADDPYARDGYADRPFADEPSPSRSFPGEAYPEQGYADQRYPEQGYSEQAYSEQGFAEQDRDGDAAPGFGGGNPFEAYDRRFGDEGSDDRRFDDGGLDPRWFDGSGVDDASTRTDDASPFAEQDDRDEVRWYADERDAAGSAATAGDGFDGFDRSGGGDDRIDEEPSPMARELAQTGYFWNLTPDPTAPDPKAAQTDDAPGPRRRGQSAPGAFAGGAAQRADDGADEGTPFDDPFLDRTADDDRSRPSDDAPGWWEASPLDQDADDPYGPRATDDLERQPDLDDRDRDDPFGLGAEPFRADLAYDDDSGVASAGRGEVRDDPYRDEQYRVDDALGHDRGGRGEPGTDTDGLASLFGGAGFGLTGPTPIAGGPASGRTPDDDPFGRAADDRYDRDPFAPDPFGRDADPFARDEPRPHDRYGDDRYGDDRNPGRATSAPRTVRDDDDRGGRSPVKVLAWIAGGLAAVLLVVAGVAFASQLLGGGEPVADEAAPVEVAEPTAVQPPGVHAWNQLFGGECLEPFDGPWAEEFTVVDCATPHTAQLVLRGEVSTDEAAPFPGEAEVATQVAALCTAEGVVNPDTATQAGDLQVAGSYPVTEEQWLDGERTYYCFVSRGGGEPITGDARGPASTQG